MSEAPDELKLVQALEEKLSALPPEKRREMLARFWKMIDEELKPESE